ncbi:ATP-dependent DNA helicase [Thiomicrospira sp. WB1]|uniref:ATP-dependent DNA helicase n=1 Tax=Thiomicrospira sp. WB1 TaxID=1685380 RepID=UPI0007480C2F|nr:ATP-dependent DNA helicase [Thiomicrospira sp. WB1]KUJ72090.1 helicase [Thiomicrospira sp. WB1]
MSLTDTTDAYFCENGRLTDFDKAFCHRDAQQSMAKAVADAIDAEATFLAEAGTGTGKTFAYLVPALLSGKKVIISTATKTLQEQLLLKDVPYIKSVTGFRGRVRLLKGRENYLCTQRLAIAQTAQANTKQAWLKLNQIEQWAQSTQDGDRAELSELDENDPVWSQVCARMEFCQANECGQSADSSCFYPKVKKAASEAEILIVNHHLFCADLALKEQGFGELLPKADVYVFDEAHQLPDVAAQFLGFRLSRYQLDELVRDLKEAYAKEAPDTAWLSDQAQSVSQAITDFNKSLGKFERRWNWQAFQTAKASVAALKTLRNRLEYLGDGLKPLTDRGKQLAALYQRVQKQASEINQWLDSDSENRVRWVESTQGRFSLHLTPLSVAGPFSRQQEKLGGSWIFTSATLSVNGEFDYFSHKLGLASPRTEIWQSPFDFASQAAIYHPVGLPSPNHDDYTRICLRAVWPLLKTTQGRAFLLFTSHSGLQKAADILRDHWEGALIVQGEGPKSSLIDRFREQERALLLGTGSFWEGVDVKGEDLVLVMIDRLPFMPPDDPLVEAREADLKQKGLSAFFHFQLPEALIAMKQGSGRLIRDATDRGVLVLCDPRLKTKSYGRQFVQNLPACPWVYTPEEAQASLTRLLTPSGEAE